MQSFEYGRPLVAQFSLSALNHNLQVVKQIVGPTIQILAMVKANAYGHGAIEVISALDADAFGVASIEEAIALRKIYPHKKFVILSGCFNISEINTALEHHFIILVHSDYQVLLLQEWAKLQYSNTQPIEVWLKMDIGMHRLGFQSNEITTKYQEITSIPHVHITTLMSHLSSDDDRNSTLTNSQIQHYQSIAKNLPLGQSLANSAAIIAWPSAYQNTNWVRPGIMLYGISPMINESAHSLDLKPVMTLSSKVIAISTLRKNDPVSYGATWRAPQDNTKIAVVAVGYGDGYPRHAPCGTPVLIKGKRYSLVGRVCMDMIMIDITQSSDITIGENVTLWGEGLPVEEVARMSGTIGYELCCHLTQRVKKIYN